VSSADFKFCNIFIFIKYAVMLSTNGFVLTISDVVRSKDVDIRLFQVRGTRVSALWERYVRVRER
jgi:hypothetical protein